MSEINNAAMREAAKKLYPDASDETIRRQLYTPVKAILNHAADEELCAPPRLKIKVQANRRTVFFKPEEVDAVLLSLNANPNAYLGPLVTFLIGQGSRMKETLTLDGRDVHLDDRLAILRLTKNGEERRVSLIPRVVAAMSNLPTIGEPGPVFRRLDGHPFKTDEAAGGQIKSAFRTAVKSAHLDERRYTPHVCRHTWATWFYAQTNDVRRLQVEGGWLSNEWQRYTKIGTPDLGRRVKRFGWDFSQKLGENLGERKADVI
ncbi:tyrosine-type recombinase/integrase [Fulvimarina manganoxydans]|uniref:tyrosine-type recombinase/integrase n=1 Tax=Fulvimarina manganoxydans TaxID=937218 RepID=UPI00148204F1|nr:tyrosine-type recombinase/integrase [Fulvimarina manganoxydans]